MKVCPKCHTPAQYETQKFCSVCGTRYPETPAAEPTVLVDQNNGQWNQPYQQPAQPNWQGMEPEQNPFGAAAQQQEKPKKNKLVLVVCIVAIVVILAGTAAALVYLRSGLTSSDKTVSDTASEEMSGAEAVSSDAAQSGTEAASPAPDATQAPVQDTPAVVTPAVASDTQVVLRNAAANGTITVDGTPVQFQYVGNDAVIPRSSLPDVCQVRIIADDGNGGYKTAAVWYNKDYGNELSFNADYGPYEACDATGLAKPGDKVVDVLTWAFYRSFQDAINEQNSGLIRYSTAANTTRCAQEIRAYTANTYDLGNFQGVCDTASINYSNGFVIYNGHFVAHRTSRSDGSTSTADHHRTLRLVWEDGMWKVDAFVMLPDGSYNSSTYATLP